MMFFLLGCVTFTQIAPGPIAGEFYVRAARGPFPRGYVLRCITESQETEIVTTCERVFDYRDAQELNLSQPTTLISRRPKD